MNRLIKDAFLAASADALGFVSCDRRNSSKHCSHRVPSACVT